VVEPGLFAVMGLPAGLHYIAFFVSPRGDTFAVLTRIDTGINLDGGLTDAVLAGMNTSINME
jgi:hypothetical protein